MVIWVQSRTVLAPQRPQCFVTLAPSLSPAQFSKRSARCGLRDPAFRVTLQGFPPERGCPELAWEFCWLGSGAPPLWAGFGFSFHFVLPQNWNVSLVGWKNIYLYMPNLASLGLLSWNKYISDKEISDFSLCFQSNALCALRFAFSLFACSCVTRAEIHA